MPHTMFVRSIPIESHLALRRAAGARLMTMGEYIAALVELHRRLEAESKDNRFIGPEMIRHILQEAGLAPNNP